MEVIRGAEFDIRAVWPEMYQDRQRGQPSVL